MPGSMCQTIPMAESLRLFTLDRRKYSEYHMRINWDKAGLRLTIASHIILYLFVVSGLITLIIHEPWYYSVMMCTFFFSPALAGIFCAFTNLENYFRLRLGLEIIPDDAISFYLRRLRSGRGSIINIV